MQSDDGGNFVSVGTSATYKHSSTGLLYTRLSTGGGGQGINGGKGGTGATGGNQSGIFGTPERTYGTDGNITAPGIGRINTFTGSPYIRSGNGGYYGESGDDPEFENLTPSVHTITTTPGAPAGAAVKGSNVTIYKSGSTLISGNSDSFTTVEV